MALKKRERMLLGATAVLVVLALGRFLVVSWGGPRSTLRTQHEQYAGEVDRKKKQIDRGNEADRRVAEWGRRALPSDLEAARSSYQNWLFSLAGGAGFRGTKVEATQGRQRGAAYHALRFTLQGQATLEEFVRFLHEFYSAGYLQQIHSVSLVPSEDGRRLSVQLSLEALALPQAAETSRLPEKPPAQALPADLATYSKAIAGRNFFAFYRAPDPPPPRPPAFDPGKFVYLTAIINVGGRPQAWMVNRTSGETLKLNEGEEFRIAEVRGKILRIGERDAEIELDGDRWRFALGDNLRELVKLPEG